MTITTTRPHSIKCGSCKLTHPTAAQVAACYDDAAQAAADIAGELYGEAVMSWVCSGGNPADASRYASVIAAGGTWDGGIGSGMCCTVNDSQCICSATCPDCTCECPGCDCTPDGVCEHGLSARLCEGPQHYPLDDPFD